MKANHLLTLLAAAVLGCAVLGGLPLNACGRVARLSAAPGGPPPGDPLGPDLYFAIRANRLDQVEELLNKGAKTEARKLAGHHAAPMGGCQAECGRVRRAHQAQSGR